MQNLGLAVISMVSGMIVDGYGYLVLEAFFIGWLTGEITLLVCTEWSKICICMCLPVALLATIVIWIYDSKHRGNLNMTPLERELNTTAT